MKAIFLFIAMIASQTILAQNIFKAIIKDSVTKEVLIGATAVLKGTTNGCNSDLHGKIEIRNIPNGQQVILFSYIGYGTIEMSFSFPVADSMQNKIIYLKPEAEKLEEALVTSTRTNSRIEDVPMRVEVIGKDEVSEESNIKPENVSKLLLESASVLAQQTSAVNGNISIRLQGLDGRYTQLLKDGFPLFGGFAEGLSILQIPPLDLKQVEIIKGSSSLYGSDAIAGIINFISRQPKEKSELTLLANQTSLLGKDMDGYFSRRWKKVGLSFLSSNNFQKQFDVNKDGFSDLPKASTYTVTPNFYYYFNPTTTLRFALNGTFDKRKGGDMKVLNNEADSIHKFFEEDISDRISSQLKFDKQFRNNQSITLKNSISYFKRSLTQPSTAFSGIQFSSYNEASFNIKTLKHQFVAGADFISESFTEDSTKSHLKRDYHYATAGVFMQDDYKPLKTIVLQAGLRTDWQNKFGFFFLPRLAVKYQFSDKFYMRAGSGWGYKVPDIFSTSSEQAGINLIKPLAKNVKAEKSIGGNLDLNYKAQLGDENLLTCNQSFFVTQISNPLVLDSFIFASGTKPIITSGFESDFRYDIDEFQFFLAYTFVNAIRKYDNIQPFVPLTPKHKVNVDIIYEKEDNFSLAFEGYFVSSMFRDFDTKTKPYGTIGFIAQKHFRHFTIIANVENLLDVRQTRFENIVIPPIDRPTFRQLYAPIDGRVFNVAIRFSL